MKQFTTVVRKDYLVGTVEDRLFGSFVEHMGSVVYNGIFQPGHPQSDENGFRTDVLDLLKPLALTAIRYPGGNYTSAYRWEDSVGPDRLPTLNLAWREFEPNTFGLHEFMHWNSRLGVQPIMTVNLGTRGAQEAADLVEYCNFSKGTRWSEMRRRNGAEMPFGIRTWCLGNELDGEWQMGHKSAAEYGRLAAITGQLMRRLDPALELICVGSSNVTLDNYPEWNREVLMECYHEVDKIALHKYLSKKGMDTTDYLCSPVVMDQMIDTVVSTCDYVGSVKRSRKKIDISFDEWNVGPVVADGDIGEWETGPMRDCISFTFEDVLVNAGMFFALLRHADRVKIACQSLLVNDLGLVLADDRGAYPNGIYPVFMALSRYARGTVMKTVDFGFCISTDSFDRQSALDTLVVKNDEHSFHSFAINRTGEDVVWKLDMRDAGKGYKVTARTICVPLETCNSLENPSAILFQEDISPVWEDGAAEGVVRAHSLTMWTIKECV